MQVLRAIAAFAVVYFHSQRAAMNRSGFEVPFTSIGAAGVDVFFVLSGFIMIYISRQRDVNPLEFGFNRFARIFPTYWLITLIFALSPVLFPGVVNNPWDWDLVLQSALLIPVDHPYQENSYSLLVFVGWTLRFELLFYAIFALSLFSRTQRFALCALGVFLCAWAFEIMSGMGPYAKELAGPDLMMIEFIYGMALAQIHFSHGAQIMEWVRKIPALAYLALLIVLLAAIFYLFALGDLRLFKLQAGLSRAFRWGIPAVLLTATFVWMVPRLLTWLGPVRTVLVAAGDASYSVYLLHILVIRWVANTEIQTLYSGWMGFYGFIATVFVLVGLLSWLLYLAFERPSIKLMKWTWARYVERNKAAGPSSTAPATQSAE
ncbi:MAG: acyltransferase [Henriciella sp.]|uniref:acyltransferase family protein n=1 Tax=Henriciella sp. TaxID=1968823 RepID=UPI003C763DA4